MATMNVSLPDTMKNWVEVQIDSGKYANASDYIRDLIRHDQKKIEILRQDLIEGKQSGLSSRNIMDILDDMKKQDLSDNEV